MLTNQLIQAATLFGLGMGTVFVLLTLLISCVTVLSFICKNFLSQSDIKQAVAAPQIKTSASSNSISDLEVSIVKAAVQAHREANA